jgi:hypothetical protein
MERAEEPAVEKGAVTAGKKSAQGQKETPEHKNNPREVKGDRGVGEDFVHHFPGATLLA